MKKIKITRKHRGLHDSFKEILGNKVIYNESEVENRVKIFLGI